MSDRVWPRHCGEKCSLCIAQDKREAPKGLKFLKLLVVGLWRRYVLRKKPVQPKPGVKTYTLPRFWCLTCEKFVDATYPLAAVDLSQPVIVQCHGKTDYYNVTLVAMMVSSVCHTYAFGKAWKRRDDRIPADILAGMNELETAL
jgi:hypothetical protein